MVNTVKNKSVEAESVLKELLGRIPAIQKIQVSDRSAHGFTVTLTERGNEAVDIRVIFLNRAVPGSVKKVVEQQEGQTNRIIMAPYISDASAAICEKFNAGYCDLSGNCLIRLDNIYIANKGNPNRYPAENPARTLFKSSARTTSRILRELVKDVSRKWKLKELAEEVGCSIGLVSRVKTYLCEQAYAAMDSSGFYIIDAEALLKEWSRSYDFPDMISCYTLESIPVFEKKCYQVFRDHGVQLCLTGFSGGVRYAPVVRYTKAHIWVARENIADFLDFTGCKEVDSGANVIVYIADSDEVFTDCREVNHSRAASPLQVFLDCMQLKGRGEEMAEAVYAKEIKNDAR